MKCFTMTLALMLSASVLANTFTVTSVGFSDYLINGQNDPQLDLIRGETYTFNVNAPDHPFWIKSADTPGSADAYNDGVTNNGTNNGVITFAVPADAPTLLYYKCGNHSGMTGKINLFDPPPDIHYVRASGSTPTAPYTNWVTAASSIQDAVDASFPGDTVVVSNGVYATGGRTFGGGSLTNRVVIDKAITVQSVNGPEVTTIQGAWDSVTTNGNNAVRGVYLGADAILSGFTVTNGATRTEFPNDYVGGGIYSEISGIVSNCVISGNIAYLGGGGVYGGTVSRSVISGNEASQIIGAGGLQNANADNCLIIGNTSDDPNSTIYSASAVVSAGTITFWPGPFAASNTIRNCTIVLNDGTNVIADNNEPNRLDVRNCVIWDNRKADQSLSQILITDGNDFQYNNYNAPPITCTSGCTTNDPQFVDSMAGNYQLRGISPGLDAGDNSSAVGATDLLGAGRIFNGTVDMGAYEAVNSDSDSLTDAEEVSKHFTNPLLGDSDSDGLDDDEEIYTHMTNPLLGDSDDDGFGDKFELDNGYSPNTNQHQVLLDYVANNGAEFGLYTTNAFQALSPGSLILEPASNDSFRVTIALQTASNLVDWTAFPMKPPQTVINAQGELEFEFPASGEVEFFRLEAE